MTGAITNVVLVCPAGGGGISGDGIADEYADQGEGDGIGEG